LRATHAFGERPTLTARCRIACGASGLLMYRAAGSGK
jgi:hypothetical protein